MIIYIVQDYDERPESINSVYDEESFKKEYKKFLDRSGSDWSRYYHVISMLLNIDENHNEYNCPSVRDFEKKVFGNQ